MTVLINSKARVRFAHRRLDVRIRLKIKVRHHEVGTWVSLLDKGSKEARAWIEDQIAKHGVLVWKATGSGRTARSGWVVQKAEKTSGVG